MFTEDRNTMQADNEQAARTKHARRGISALAGVSPAAVTVCVPCRACPQEGTARAAPAHGSSPQAQPQHPKTREQPHRSSLQSWDGLGLALGQNHTGTALARSHMGWNMENSCFQGFRTLPGKGTAPTSPQPGFGLGQSLPVQEGTLWCSHI